MRLTIKGTPLIDCGGTLADLGREEMSRRYRDKSVLAIIKLSQYEDIDESPEHLAKVYKALEIAKEKRVNMYILQWKDMTCERYNERMDWLGLIPTDLFHLTQEEFDLLKEVLL